MKERKLEQVFQFILMMFAVFFGLCFIKSAGAVLRTGVESMWLSCNNLAEKVVTRNHLYILELNPELTHYILETVLWTPVIWAVRKRRVVNKGLGYFILMTILILIALEVFSYIAYVLQFIGDACVAGISSKEPSLVLKNIVSWNRWLNVDWAGRICEAVVASTILAFVGGIVERQRARRAKRKAAAEKERLKHEEKRAEKEKRRKQEEAEFRRESDRVWRQTRKVADSVSVAEPIALPGSVEKTVPEEG